MLQSMGSQRVRHDLVTEQQLMQPPRSLTSEKYFTFYELSFFFFPQVSSGDITFELHIWRLKYREAKSVALESQRDLTDGWSSEGIILLILSCLLFPGFL